MTEPPLQVLLVEDSALTAEQLIELIRSVPVEVAIETAVTEREAIAALRRGATHLVVLDLKLRQGSGFNVLRTLAALDSKPATVVLTNYALPKYRELAMLTGADYFLDKAVDFKSLPAIVESVAAKHRAIAR